jgi:hypothetical protein
LATLEKFADDASLIRAFTEGMKNATGSLSVDVILHFIKVAVSYSGFPDFSDSFSESDITDAVASANDVLTAAVAVSTMDSRRLARRLSRTASTTITVVDTPETDVVQKANSVMTSSANTGKLAEHLRNVTDTTVPIPTLQTAPSATVSATTSVSGGSNTQLDVTAISAALSDSVGGEVTVSEIDGISNISTYTTTTSNGTNIFATTTSPLDNNQNNDARAFAATTIWILGYVFVIS